MMLDKYLKFSKESNVPHNISNIKMKDKEHLLLAYLFFNSNPRKLIYTSLNAICSDLSYKISNRGDKSHQASFKDVLDQFLGNHIIQYKQTEYTSKWDDITDQKLFVLSLDSQFIYDVQKKYVELSLSEFEKILTIAKDNNFPAHKIFNFYLFLKSLICMDANCLHYCYPSLQWLSTKLSCNKKTLMQILKMLYDAKMIYIYHFYGEDSVYMNYRPIEYVFTIEPYTKDQIRKEFK